MFNLRYVPFAIGLLVLALQCDCARSRAQQHAAEACAILAQSAANQESAFVARARAIRGTHLLLRDYDRQMIALLEERLAAIRSMHLADSSAGQGVSGCSGRQLEDLRREAGREMARLDGFLDTFKRGLQDDPAGVFIDER